MISRIPLPLRLPLLFALITALAGGALVAATQAEHRQLDHALADAQAVHDNATLRLAQLEASAAQLRGFATRYRALVERGVVAADHEALRDAALHRILAEHGIADGDYTASTPRPLSPQGANLPVLMASTIKLHATVRHEQALLDLLDTLRHEASAAVSVRGCAVERLPSTEVAAAMALQIRCEFAWLNIRPPAGEAS
ncbi:hypothetical protein CJ010_04900 [Azoarcus sp. DD4]|uniref:hypothetical protein n=1 Tax=Azoarcus sp. DD4 TaxID=2027405 RepID=UPI00112996D6|nr:hypothetical protein [Azoarcus sp. DD4]QDF95923.1 hypothetical protein CJ010_04900 [Azoarcus sp. DD4]